MTQSPRDALTQRASFRERGEISEQEEDVQTRRSAKRVAIKRPPRVPNDEGDGERAAPRTTLRRTRTVPTQGSQESIPPPFERRSRRNLSRLLSEGQEDDILLDSSKRISTSQRSLGRTPSERVLQPTLSKRSGRAATPLDIPFAPNPGLPRTLSAENRLEDLLEIEADAPRTSIRRTQTHVPSSGTEGVARQSSLPRDPSLKLDLEALTRPPNAAMAPSTSAKSGGLMDDSAKFLEGPRKSKKGKVIAMPSSSDETDTEEHVITIDRPSKKSVPPSEKRSSKKVVAKSTSQKSTKEEAKQTRPLTWVQLLLHFFSLLFVQYPFKYHRQWKEKMYRSNRIKKPPQYKPAPDWALTSTTSLGAGFRGASALPSLPENTSGFTPRNARSRRRTQLDEEDSSDELSSGLESQHRKRSSRHLGQLSLAGGHMKPPPGHLPRSQNISVERSRRKKSRKSVEIFGDIMHALGVNTKGGRLKLPFGLSEMDESELSGFQARLYKFIKRQHKGRLARAWDHMVHPLGSMQKKHRRSTNKTRLLNAIDKHRAQRFDDAIDLAKTHMFLVGQWVFEALSPPKYTKKPMLFTVLFPLVQILFFGFMAGEYPLWRESKGDKVEYEFGPEELATWLFRAEKWRTFDDGFLIVWGARYLPLVTTESWRWLFSMLVHENFAHLGGNLFLFVILSWSLESKYGFIRTGLICWLSGISGNFMSAALEESCGLVLGASGCVFGLAAFYIMDVMGDFKYVSFPCLRLIGICTFLSAFIIALSSHQEASHFSHIGGFLCGMGLSVVLVPRFIDERIEAFLPWIALFSGILLLCVFPLVVLLSVIPNLQCKV